MSTEPHSPSLSELCVSLSEEMNKITEIIDTYLQDLQPSKETGLFPIQKSQKELLEQYAHYSVRLSRVVEKSEAYALFLSRYIAYADIRMQEDLLNQAERIFEAYLSFRQELQCFFQETEQLLSKKTSAISSSELLRKATLLQYRIGKLKQIFQQEAQKVKEIFS